MMLFRRKVKNMGNFKIVIKLGIISFRNIFRIVCYFIYLGFSEEKYRFADVVEKMKGIATDLIHAVATQLNPERK